jgi:hypothetical protein
MSWKSLAEVYTDNIIRKPLSEAKVTLTIDDQTHEFDSLSDKYIEEVVRRMYFLNSGVEKNLLTWINKGDWVGSEDRVLEQLNTILSRMQSGKDIQVFSKEVSNDIAAILEFTKSPKFNRFILDQNTDKDLLQLFSVPGLRHLNKIDFIADLFQIVFPINQVNIGPGEVALTLFTEATKQPHKGDFKVGDLNIEFKGSRGRIGKGEEEMRVFKTKISPQVGKDNIKQHQIALFDKLKENFIHELSAEKVFELYNFKGYKQSNLYKVLQGIENSKNLDEFYIKASKNYLTDGEVKKHIKKIEDLINQSVQIDRSQKSNNQFEKYATVYSAAIKDAANIYKFKEGAETQQFRTYFSSPESAISSDEKIETICDYAIKNNKELEELVRNYFIGGNAEGLTLPAEQIITAISIANYHQKEKFDYIIFADTDPGTIRSGKIPCKIIGPMQDDYTSNVRLAIENINNIIVSPNADRGGFQVNYKPTVVQGAEAQGDTGQYMQSTYGVPLIQPGAATNDKAQINIPV